MNGTQGGALSGLALGLGVLLIGSWLAGRRRLPIVDRIGPFAGIGPAGASRPVGPVTEVVGWIRPRTSRGADPLDAHRLERTAWAAVGAVMAPLLVLPVSGGGGAAWTVGLLAAAGGSAGWWLGGARLTAVARGRRRVMESHLPMLADLLALAVSSGTSPLVALERASATMTGPLADEVAVAAADVHGGTGVEVALRRLADRTGLVSVQRFVDGIVIALERGTPLGDVLRAQAADVRAAEARRLMELAGRKDVVMLVPVVFLVLPGVVLVAVYPGVQALRLVVP